MRCDLERQLQRDFPFMKPKAARRNDYDIYGCECRNGWYSIIYDMCREIAKKYAEDNTVPDIFPDRIGEKYGELCVCFYYDISSDSNFKLKKLHDDIYSIINKYENKSIKVCEYCGKSGKLREDLNWIKTLCGKCYVKELRTSEMKGYSK